MNKNQSTFKHDSIFALFACFIILFIPFSAKSQVIIKGSIEQNLKDAISTKLSTIKPSSNESIEILIISLYSAPEIITLDQKGALQFTYGNRTAKFLIEIKKDEKLIHSEIVEVAIEDGKDIADAIASEAVKRLDKFRN